MEKSCSYLTTYSFVIWEPSSEYSAPLRSEEFSINGAEPLRWRINIRHEKRKAKGKTKEDNNAMLYLSLSKRSYPLPQFDFPVKVKFSIQRVRNGNGFDGVQDRGASDLIHIGSQTFNTLSTSQFHLMNLITSYCASELTPSSTHIAINLEFRNGPISDVVNILMLGDPESHAVNLARSLREEKEHRDFAIVVAGKEFRAHKAVLAVQCPYFQGLLRSGGLQETQENKVHLEDIEPEIFEKLLHFMYTGEVEDMQKHAHQLVQAANRFLLNELKNRCVLLLYNDLSVETVCDTLVLADQHSIVDLKEQALNFIRDNCAAVKKTKGFESLTANHAKLAIELLTRMMDSA